MDFDTERGQQKRLELVGIVEHALHQQGLSLVHATTEGSRSLAAAIVENFADVEPPEAPPRVVYNVTMRRGGYGGAISVKPGNIRLNLRKFVNAIASGVLTIAGITSAPWTAIFAAIVLWDQLWSSLQIKISEAEAAVLWVMWINRNEDNEISQVGLLENVNSALSREGDNRLTQHQLNRALKLLERLRCIECSETDSSRWWLREWVEVSYT